MLVTSDWFFPSVKDYIKYISKNVGPPLRDMNGLREGRNQLSFAKVYMYIYLFLLALGLCSAFGLSLVAASRGYSSL